MTASINALYSRSGLRAGRRIGRPSALHLCPKIHQRTVLRASTAAASTAAYASDETNQSHEHQKYQHLLQWASADGSQPAVAVSADKYGGRCLRAIRSVEPGGVLLSVPMTKVFASKVPQHLEMHWSADQALELLKLKHQQHQQHQHSSSSSSSTTTSTTSSGSSSEVDWYHWLICLPPVVHTPLEFDHQMTQQLGLASTVQDVEELQQVVAACYEEAADQLQQWGYGWQDFLWAVQVLHSRCFFEPTLQQHLCVPGVDMANHSPQPSGVVRIQHSPGMAQGLAALEDVAPLEQLAALAAPASYFQLVAGDEGVQEGQEVTISYGPWPNEVFLTLFGFVPAPNPQDQLILYSSLSDMAAHICQYLTHRMHASHRAAAGRAQRMDPAQVEGGNLAAVQQGHQQNDHQGAAVPAGSTTSSSSNRSAATTQGPPQAAAAAGQQVVPSLLLDALQHPELKQQVMQLASASSDQEQDPSEPGSSGFLRLIATADGLDARLTTAFQQAKQLASQAVEQQLQHGALSIAAATAAGPASVTPGAADVAVPTAAATAAQVWQQQLQGLSLRDLVVARLRGLQQQLELQHPAAAAAGGQGPTVLLEETGTGSNQLLEPEGRGNPSGAGDTPRSKHPGAEGQGQTATAGNTGGGGQWEPEGQGQAGSAGDAAAAAEQLAAHQQLVQQYRQQRLVLLQQVLGKMSG